MIDEKQGEDIAILDVSGPLVIADYFVITSSRNARHARAIANDLMRSCKQVGRSCRHAAGIDNDSPWVLLDFDDVVVHIFHHDARSFYDIERLWADVPRVAFVPTPRPAPVTPSWENQPDSLLPDSGAML